MSEDKSKREAAASSSDATDVSEAAPRDAGEVDAPTAGDASATTDAPIPRDAPPEEPPPEARAHAAPISRRRRTIVLAACAIAALVAVIAIVFATRRHGGEREIASASPTGPAALRAPEPPTLPSATVIGARITGLVVDGAGLPVANAEVSAELERGAPDRALAPRASAGSGSGSGANAGSGSGANAGSNAPAPAVHVASPTTADGRFAILGLVPGRFRLRVTGVGLVPAEVRYVPVPSDETRIVVARQVAIEGTVTDGGKPVVNAQVGLRGDAIGGTIELRTDAAGAFKFPRLPEGRYQLFAWQGALAARTVRVARLGAGPFAPVELRLEAAAIVVGRVIDRDEGTGLAAAIELRPQGDDQAPRYARSGDDGVFRIEGVPNGTWIAEAFAPGYLSTGGIELLAGRGVPELALSRGGAIEGRVLDGDGHPVAGAAVRALTGGSNPTEVSGDVDRDKLRRFSGRTAAPVPITPSSVGDDPQLIARGELGVLAGPIPPIPPPGAHVAQAAIAIDPSLAGEPPALPGEASSIWVTGADGTYRIRGLGRSKVTVLASAAGFAEARSSQVAVEPGQIVRGVDLVVTPGTMIVGKVTDQHGTPVAGAQITATPSGDNQANGAPLDAFSDDAGAYKLGPVTGRITLRASAYGHGEAARAIELAPVRGADPGERREDLVLAVADAMVAGILEDATGAPVAGGQLEIVGGASEGRRAVAAADGTFAIDRLPAGRARLHIEHPSYPPYDVDVTAESGHPAHIRLRLPLGGAVEGVVLDFASGAPLANISLAAAGPGNALAEASTDTTGRWKLGPLRPGRWRISLKQPGYLALARDLDVPVSRTPGATSVHDIRLELARGALVGGTVRDSRGQRVAAAHITATGGGATCEGDSDPQGEFRLRDCPTGDLVVSATKNNAGGAIRVTVRPGDEILSLALELR